jgi:hypothetical protein
VTKEKTGDPRDGEQHEGGARFMPVGCGFGETAVVVPAPMTCGRPQPEPEERWTLAPGHRPAAPGSTVDEPVEGVVANPEPAEP